MRKKHKLNDLAAYQEGIVASRALIDTGAGTVTFFAFDKGQGLSEHTTPFDAFVYISDGQAEVTVDGETNILDAGETITLPANKPHKLTALSSFKMLLVMVKATK